MGTRRASGLQVSRGFAGRVPDAAEVLAILTGCQAIESRNAEGRSRRERGRSSFGLSGAHGATRPVGRISVFKNMGMTIEFVRGKK